MNTHQLWLKQLQEQVGQRKEKGQFTTTEMNQKQFENRKPLQEEPQQLDELGPLLPIISMASKAMKVAGKVKTIVKGAAAVAGGGNSQQEQRTAEDKLNAIMEEIVYEMIEELEEQIGRRLFPEEIQEFVENNYEFIESACINYLEENSQEPPKPINKGSYNFEYSTSISQDAKERITANAIPGDKNTGVGATKPEEPTSKPLPPLKAKASALGKKTSGTEY